MRFQRLLMEVGSTTVNLDFHPKLTVVAGVGTLEREGLITELLSGLGGGRPGTHLQIVDESGRRLGILHPVAEQQEDRVMELGTHEDVTAEFMRADGTIDLLSPLGLNIASARRHAQLTAADMAETAKTDNLVVALAARDQPRLWKAAENVRNSRTAVEAEVSASGADPVDTPLVEEIEVRHAAFEGAQERLERVRHFGIFVGGASVAGAIPAVAMKSWVAIPLLLVAIVTTMMSIMFRRRLDKAHKAERKVLDEVGADSYLAFRLARVNGLVDGGANRATLTAAVTAHREAMTTWRALAGDVSAEWAFDMRDKVAAAALRLRDADASGEPVSGPAVAEPTELAQGLITKMSELRHVGPRNEAFPMLLDEPLEGVALSTKQWLLELLGRSAGAPQVIYLTDDPDVAAWARMHSVGGELAIIEAAPERDGPSALAIG